MILFTFSCSSGISTVVNLQLPWEHSKCGPGIESSGFTYQPEELMRHGGKQDSTEFADVQQPTLSYSTALYI